MTVVPVIDDSHLAPEDPGYHEWVKAGVLAFQVINFASCCISAGTIML
jgi:lipoprotein signal peptidase